MCYNFNTKRKGIRLRFLSLLLLLSLYASASAYEQPLLDANQSQALSKELHYYQKLFDKDMGSAGINHKLALLNAQLGFTDEALAAYERLRIIDETNALYIIEEAELYMRLKMYADAALLLDMLKNPDKALALRKKKMLDYIESLRKKHTLIALLNLGYGVDDNVNNSAAESVLSDYFGSNFDASNQTPLSDQYLQAVASLISHYDVGEAQGFYIQNALTLLSKNQVTYSDYNLLFGKLSLGAGYKGTRFLNTYAFEYDHINYGGTALINAYAFSPKLSYSLSSTLLINADFKYQQKRYIDSANEDKNSHNYTLESAISWMRPFNTIRGFYRYQGARKMDASSTQSFIDYNAHLLGASYLMKLAPEFSIRLRYQIRAVLYSDNAINTTQARQDITQNYTVSLSRILSKHLSLAGQYNSTTNTSNSTLLSYKKTQFEVNINYTY